MSAAAISDWTRIQRAVAASAWLEAAPFGVSWVDADPWIAYAKS